MPFGSYSSLGDIARVYQITCTKANFVEPMSMPVSEHLRGDLDFAQKYVGFEGSEFAACESLIYPILLEVWKSAYLDDLQFWPHTPLHYDADLSGTPDYFIARKSPLGPVVVDKPYLMVMEAKRDDPYQGWGQCLAAMIAAQKLNDRPDVVMHGITTNGRYWQFGKLQGNNFTQELQDFTLSDLDQLAAGINYLFDQCRQQLAAFVSAA